MPALLMAAIAAVGLLVLKKRQAAAAAPPKPRALPPLTTEGVVGGKTDMAAIQAHDIAVGAGKALDRFAKAGASIAGGNYIGGALEGAGAIAAAEGDLAYSLLGGGVQGDIARIAVAIPLPGNPGTGAAAGAIIGREVDKLLGGTGNDVRGYVAMGLGAVVGAVFLCAGCYVGYIYLYIAIIIYGVFVWADQESHRIGTLHGDIIRTYEKEYWDLVEEIRTKLHLHDTVATRPQIERFARCFADGFCLRKNRNNYNAAMQLSWGIGANRHSHAQWQLEFGRFIGVILPNGDLDDRGITRHARDADHIAVNVPPGERVPNPIPEDLLAQSRTAKASGLWIDAAMGPSLEESWPKWKDVAEETIAHVGDVCANAAAYASWMAQNWGVSQSETSHGAYGRNHGYFEGYFEAPGPFRFYAAKNGKRTICSGTGGLLFYNGHHMYWRDEAGDAGPFVSVSDEVPVKATMADALRNTGLPMPPLAGLSRPPPQPGVPIQNVLHNTFPFIPAAPAIPIGANLAGPIRSLPATTHPAPPQAPRTTSGTVAGKPGLDRNRGKE